MVLKNVSKKALSRKIKKIENDYIAKYAKLRGDRAERELIKLLSSLDFSAARIAGSGNNTADVIASKRGNIFAFECKSWATTVRIKEKQLDGLLEFSEKAMAIPLIAIKKEREGWKFLKAEDVKENKGVVSKKLIEEKGFGVEFFENY